MLEEEGEGQEVEKTLGRWRWWGWFCCKYEHQCEYREFEDEGGESAAVESP